MSESSVLLRKISVLEAEVERLRAVEAPTLILPVTPFLTATFPLAAAGAPYVPFIFTIPRDGHLYRMAIAYNIATTNNGGNYWNFYLTYTITAATIQAVSTAATTPNAWTYADTRINGTTGVDVNALSNVSLYILATVTGAPGDLYMAPPVVWMI